MRATTLATVLVLGLGGGALATPAAASGSWFVGADFAVGGVHFSLGYHEPDRRYGPYRPAYYYRTAPSFAVRGLGCSSACYLDRGYAYHGPSCPVVSAYFGHHHFDAGHLWGRLGWGGSHGHGYVYHGQPFWYGHRTYRYDHGRRHYGDHHYGHRDGRHYGYRHDDRDRYRDGRRDGDRRRGHGRRGHDDRGKRHH